MSEVCPFCNHDPYHYVDNGVGMEAVAVTCCDLGAALYARNPTDEITMSRDEFVEIATRLAKLERAESALEEIAESRDAGRHDGLPEPYPVHEQYAMWSIAREALASARTTVEKA